MPLLFLHSMSQADYVWCGAESYSILQTGHITLYNTLELLMMGIVVPETC